MPRWAPLYAFLLAVGTWSPFTLGSLTRAISLRIEAHDLLLNAVLFLPLGVAFQGRGWRRAALVAGLYSLVLEFGQLFLLRTPSPIDWALNTLSAALGARLPLFHWSARWRRLFAVLSLAMGLGLHGLLLEAARAQTEINLSIWQSMPIVFGNEPDAQRPFHGEIASAMLFGRRLSDRELEQLGRERDPDAPLPSAIQKDLAFRMECAGRARIESREASGRLRQFSFDEGVQRATTEDSSGQRFGTLMVRPQALPWFRKAEYDSDRTSDWTPPSAFTLVIAFTPLESDLVGERRIFVYGRSIWRKNLSLGLYDGALDWRVASTVTDVAGNGPGLKSWRAWRPPEGGPALIAARFDQQRTRIDAWDSHHRRFRPVAEAALAPLATPPPLRQGGPALLALASALSALGIAEICRRPGTRRVTALLLWLLVLSHGRFSGLGVGTFAAYGAANAMVLPALFAIPIALLCARGSRGTEERVNVIG